MISAGATAPPFSLKDLDGRDVALTDVLAVSPVLLVFFRSGCGLCQWAVPQLDRFAEYFAGATLSVFGVTADHAEVARHVVDDLKLNLIPLLDEGGQVTSGYGVEQLPAVVFIYPDGTVASATEGWDPAALTKIGKDVNELVAYIRGPSFTVEWTGDPCPAITNAPAKAETA